LIVRTPSATSTVLLYPNRTPDAGAVDNRAGRQRGFDRACLLVIRTSTATAPTIGDRLNATRRRGPMVKPKIKSGHKPVAIPGDQTRRSGNQTKGAPSTALCCGQVPLRARWLKSALRIESSASANRQPSYRCETIATDSRAPAPLPAFGRESLGSIAQGGQSQRL
jgi:hypothetical protein